MSFLHGSDFRALIGEQPASAAPLLRGIMHECDRFVRNGFDSQSTAQPSSLQSPDSPLVFGTIQGSALYLMGNLVQDDPSILTSDEPNEPSTYFKAASDIFRTTSNKHPNTSQKDHGWKARLEFSWGHSILGQSDPPDLEVATAHFTEAAHIIQLAPALPGDSEDRGTLSPKDRTTWMLQAAEAIMPHLENHPAMANRGLGEWHRWILQYLKDIEECDQQTQLDLIKGTSYLGVGSVYAEQHEAALEKGDDAWDKEACRDGRDALRKGGSTPFKAGLLADNAFRCSRCLPSEGRGRERTDQTR